MRFLFASDSFKGTISSARAGELLREAAHATFPDVHTHILEVADGGEGTVDAIVAATGGTKRSVQVTGPLGVPTDATYGLLSKRQAIIEMAAASGLPLVSKTERNPLLTSTFGTGELIRDALNQGARDISLAIGGSATNDGGMGCMRALGFRFLDASDRELAGTGADLAHVARIDTSSEDKRIDETTFHVMCDVDNPLLGTRGATRVFGPQKGASKQVVEELELGMAHYSHVLEATFVGFDAQAPGMGAAGGLGAATRAFLNAQLIPGIECVLDLVGFDDLLNDCDLCVTGEGHADAQSAHGKVISGIAKRCKAHGVPCVAVVGGMDADACALMQCGVDAIVPTVIDVASLDETLAHAEENYSFAAQRLFSLLRIGNHLR